MDKLTTLSNTIKDHDETQQILADKIGVNRNQIRRWINGESEMGIYKLKAICEYYNVSADYILGLAPDMEWPRGKETTQYIRNRTKYTFLCKIEAKTANFDQNTADRNIKNDQCINKECCIGWKTVLKYNKFDINKENPFGSKCCAFRPERIFA